MMDPMDLDPEMGVVVSGSITDEQWDTARPLIERLYIEENKPYEYVAKAILTEFGFRPTKRQFNRKVSVKWELRKNTSLAQRRLAVQQLEFPVVGPRPTSTTVEQTKLPLSAAKLKRWKKQLGGRVVVGTKQQVIAGAVTQGFDPEEERRLSLTDPAAGQSSVLETALAKHQPQQNIWERTGKSIIDSPTLTQLFEALRISSCDFSDDEIPLISLSENQDEADKYVSPTEVRLGERSIEISYQVRTSPLRSTLVMVYNRSTNMISLTNLDNAKAVMSWQSSIAYNAAGLDHELYPFVNCTPGANKRVSSSRNDTPTLDFYERRLADLLVILPRDHPDTISAMEDLADEYYDQGKLFLEEPLRRDLVKFFEEIYGDDHPRTLNAALDLIYTMINFNSYKAAERYNQIIRARILAKHFENHELLSRVLLSSGLIAYNLRKYIEAEEWDRQALSVRIQSYGPRHDLTLIALTNLGQSMRERENYPQAEQIFRMVAQISYQEATANETKWKTLSDLAVCLSIQNLFTEAIALIEFVVARLKSTITSLSLTSVGILFNHSYILQSYGNYRRSIEVYREAISGSLELLGEFHHDTVVLMNLLADGLYQIGEYDEARSWYARSLTARVLEYGIEHKITLEACHNLAYCYQKLGKYDKALELYQDTIEKLKLVDGDVTAEIAHFEGHIDNIHETVASEESEPASGSEYDYEDEVEDQEDTLNTAEDKDEVEIWKNEYKIDLKSNLENHNTIFNLDQEDEGLYSA